MQNASLPARFRTVRRRLMLIGMGRAVAWACFGAMLLLLVGMWLDLLWDLSATGRIATWCGVAGLAMVVTTALAWTAVVAGRDRLVARRLDRTGKTGGQILTGFELQRWPSSEPQGHLSAGLARLAVAHAESVAATVRIAEAAPVRPLGRSLLAVGGLLMAVGLLAVCLPELARTQWDRFAHPLTDAPPFSPTQFHVTPGDVEVLYGDELEIEATVEGPAVDQAELVLENPSGNAETLPMFPTNDGGWRAVLAKVTDETVYHVRSYGTRSARYHIGVITVPQLESVRVEVTPPAYTNQAPTKGPVPREGIAGLPTTRVRIWARSNRPLSGGTIALEGDLAATDGANGSTMIEVPMVSTTEDAREAVGQFEITADGKFTVRVRDAEGQTSRQSLSASVTLLPDERPFIRLTRPRKESLATPNVLLPVSLAAEDDYGVSRVQLYRSLNESRAMPVDVGALAKSPRRVLEQVDLPLAAYGLVPGDVIKLFGRVEDNDPAGAKGSETEVATIRIISQEEFERLVQIREGFEVLQSKYREARRRMESMAEETERLRKKTAESPPDAQVSEETREELQRHLMRLRKESESLRKLMQHKLPFDLDKNLGPELEQVASMTDEMADELEKLLAQRELLNEQATKRLEALAERLAGQQEQYSQTVSLPMEYLEAVFPLLVAQERFKTLVLRQTDLAERLAPMKGRDGEDNPALKARMRDLEQEQQELRTALDALLGDIVDHVARLPEDSRFDRLRQTASEFAEGVRESGAIEVMAEAEVGLAEFSGTRGHEKAQRAAEILQKFLQQDETEGGMSGSCLECLVFQPTLSNALGMSIDQMLAGMGLGQGSGFGGGMGGLGGGQGGYGLYGGMPGMGARPWGGPDGAGRDSRRAGRYASGSADPRNQNATESTVSQASLGGDTASIPVRFRRRVGEYFQRVAEEMGE